MEKENKILFHIKEINNNVVKIMTKDAIEKNIPIMSSTQFLIVNYLLSHNKKANQKDIEKDLNMSRSTISGVLKTMEKNQIIKSITSKDDSRTNEISLTEISKERHLQSKKKIEEIDIINKIENNLKTYKEEE